MTLIEMLYAVILLIIKLFLWLLAFALTLFIFVVAREVAYMLRVQNKKNIKARMLGDTCPSKAMEEFYMKLFDDFCPANIGDELYTRKKTAWKIAHYLEEEAGINPEENWLLKEILKKGIVKKQTITDIVAVRSTKNEKGGFLYELDNSGNYEVLKIYVIQ